MKMNPYVIKLIGLSIALSASLAVAGELPTTFEQFDADGNGYISAEEATARQNLSDNFQTSDKNGDGKLNSTEFSAFEGQGRFTPPEESEISEPGAAPY